MFLRKGGYQETPPTQNGLSFEVSFSLALARTNELTYGSKKASGPIENPHFEPCIKDIVGLIFNETFLEKQLSVMGTVHIYRFFRIISLTRFSSKH